MELIYSCRPFRYEASRRGLIRMGDNVSGPQSNPEVLIRCGDLLARVQTLVLIKKTQHSRQPVDSMEAVHPRSTRAN